MEGISSTNACAGELLQGERDALLKLIQSLRHEYEAVQLAKQGQESELQGLKVSLIAHITPTDRTTTYRAMLNDVSV